MADRRLLDRIRGRVHDPAGGLYRNPNGSGAPWEDVLLCRYLEADRTVTVDAWGRAPHHPDLQAEHSHPTDPRYVFLASMVGGDLLPMPHKGRQRILRLPDGTDLTVDVSKNCCSSPFRDFWP